MVVAVGGVMDFVILWEGSSGERKRKRKREDRGSILAVFETVSCILELGSETLSPLCNNVSAVSWE